jgi:hypothetical protein
MTDDTLPRLSVELEQKDKAYELAVRYGNRRTTLTLAAY